MSDLPAKCPLKPGLDSILDMVSGNPPARMGVFAERRQLFR